MNTNTISHILILRHDANFNTCQISSMLDMIIMRSDKSLKNVLVNNYIQAEHLYWLSDNEGNYHLTQISNQR